MARVIGQSGALTELQRRLRSCGVGQIQSTADAFRFRQDYEEAKRRATEEKRAELTAEIEREKRVLTRLKSEYSADVTANRKKLLQEAKQIDQWFGWYRSRARSLLFRLMHGRRRQEHLQRLERICGSFDEEACRPLIDQSVVISKLELEILDKERNPEPWVQRVASAALHQLECADAAIEQNGEFLYGAVGEERAIAELSALPDQYVVVNDYRAELGRPIYDRRNDDRIYSVQVDHVVIGPTGLFLVETKN